MSRNSPSARKHRALKFLAHLVHYKKYGPLVGPKEEHQPEHQWPGVDADLVLFVAQIFPHAEGQALWWEAYTTRTPAKRQELVDDLRLRVARDDGLRRVECKRTVPHGAHSWVIGDEYLKCLGLPE